MLKKFINIDKFQKLKYLNISNNPINQISELNETIKIFKMNRTEIVKMPNIEIAKNIRYFSCEYNRQLVNTF